MSRKTVITKELIIKKSFELMKCKGLESISARNIASYIGCSTQPIFSYFDKMEDLKQVLLGLSYDIYSKYLFEVREDVPLYMGIGLGYITFAKEEKELFKIMFMSKENKTLRDSSNLELGVSHKLIMEKLNIDLESAKKFHLEMWIFTHGLAVLIASDNIDITYEEIKQFLTDEYIALSRRWKNE